MSRIQATHKRRRRKSKILPYILGSILFHLLILAILIVTNIDLVDRQAKNETEKPEFIEITELPVPKEKETKPPEKPKRLAKRSHIAPEEKTRDDFTKRSPAVPPQPKMEAQPKPKPKTEQTKKTEKKEEAQVTKKPKEAETKQSSSKESLLRDKKLASLPKEILRKESQKARRETRTKDISKITRDDLFRSTPSTQPQRQRNPQDFLGARDVEKKEDTVDLSTTEFKYLSYFLKLKSQIEAVWNYPKESRYKGEQGTLFLVFTIGRSGELIDIQLLASSGHARLDNEALRAIREASPFPPFPQSWGQLEKLNVRASFTYGYGGFIR